MTLVRGELNGQPVSLVRAPRPVDEPYPGGESWRDAASRTFEFLRDLFPAWDGSVLS